MAETPHDNKWDIFLLLFALGILVGGALMYLATSDVLRTYFTSEEDIPHTWEFRSIDTMKYSRDLADSNLGNDEFNRVIDSQIKQIAETGATHVAIGTPYDSEFLPFLRRWVSAARRYNLKVWFRGNFSGWEGWFDYEKIDRKEHTEMIRKFIEENPDLFEDGDAFSSCPECENGGPGDPRQTGDVAGHRQFLIDEYAVTKQAFSTIGKDVMSNFHSMNGDVARLIMDEQTTSALGNLIVVDHYVKDPKQLAYDMQEFSKNGTVRVVLGEYGVPIPDIHSQMTEDEQAQWLSQALTLLADVQGLYGLNYWTSVGGSTQLWDENGTPKKAVEILSSFYSTE